MTTPVTVPQENVNDTSVTLVRWLVSDGDMVEEGQDVAELESSKATYEAQAPASGPIHLLAKESTDVSVHSVIAQIGEESPSLVATETSRAEGTGTTRFSKAAKELIEEHGIDSSVFQGMPLVREPDVLSHLSADWQDAEAATASEASQLSSVPEWVDHDDEPEVETFGLYSRSFARRIVGGGYGEGNEQPNYLRIFVADTLWLCHFPALAVLWLFAKIPIISTLFEIVARVYSRNSMGFFLRGAYYKAKLKMMGQDVMIDQGVEIWGGRNVSVGNGCHIDMFARIAAGESSQGQHGEVTIGSHVHIGPRTQLAGRGGIHIGSYTAITAGAMVFSATNVGENPEDPTDLLPMSHAAPLDRQHIHEAPVHIGDHVFVGLNVCVLPGVEIGRGTIVNSGAVVTRSLPAFSLVKGGSMKVYGTRRPNVG